ncbi:MAG: hypothetical protein U5K37_12970 [Natrialbaceae archaeon]|nr:hypothetical protein [Natrialbaceae archaeon]
MTDELDPKLIAGTVVGAVLLGLYAAWIAADLLARWLTFGIVAIGAGYVLFSKEEIRGQFVYAAYVFAGLLVLTPVFMVMPDVLSAEAYGRTATELIFLGWNFYMLLDLRRTGCDPGVRRLPG